MKTKILFMLSMNIVFSTDLIAGCDTNISGQSEKYLVEIVRDCGVIPQIFVSEFDDHEYTNKHEPIAFESECAIGKDEELTCHAGGKTILSGATFRVTNDGMPSCAGDSYSPRYTCVKGCNEDVPKYLRIAPYEC